ncbi:hypothetical protein CTKZ_31130 [Cellulomonas algicola]|uniref:Uncharacterized protein n=1 Tax=Cellulomonas algicola TaxID=2071633 RepID=A0A401V3V2_9CELL|nr:SIR2 family protein [Cellulomonas algicola]GCD21551.1 hypothetical protein CTKZ_31130 [Cellulomonas algicola]
MAGAGTFDPRTALAMGLHSQPGVYALLIGSGVSTGAGLPTAWKVVEALTAQHAAAAGLVSPGDDFDADAWWAAEGNGEPLTYSGLLEALASTPAARRALLARFFEDDDDTPPGELKRPTAAHRAIAELVRRGFVRLIITTNFDRLIEHALSEAGINAQVISSPAQLAGMEPIQHTRCTVLKIHGDYASMDQLNTAAELSTYHHELRSVLERVFDEHGLVISGWSGDSDAGLAEAIDGTRTRRYPMYFAARTTVRGRAAAVVARHHAHVVEGVSADDFFPDLIDRVDALQRLAEPPISQAIAVERLKRYLPDPVMRLRLRDLVLSKVIEVEERIGNVSDESSSSLLEALRPLIVASESLLVLLAHGVALDRAGEHDDLWVTVVDRLIDARRSLRSGQSYVEWRENLQHLPAMLAMYTGVAAAAHVNNERLLVRLMTEPRWRGEPFGESSDDVVAVEALNPWRVLDHERLKDEYRPSEDSTWRCPWSHLLAETIPPLLGVLNTSPERQLKAYQRAEYRVALGYQCYVPSAAYGGAPLGDITSGHWAMRQDAPSFPWRVDWEQHADMSPWREAFDTTDASLATDFLETAVHSLDDRAVEANRARRF